LPTPPTGIGRAACWRNTPWAANPGAGNCIFFLHFFMLSIIRCSKYHDALRPLLF
jgi:hypothetical protein